MDLGIGSVYLVFAADDLKMACDTSAGDLKMACDTSADDLKRVCDTSADDLKMACDTSADDLKRVFAEVQIQAAHSTHKLKLDKVDRI